MCTHCAACSLPKTCAPYRACLASKSRPPDGVRRRRRRFWDECARLHHTAATASPCDGTNGNDRLRFGALTFLLPLVAAVIKANSRHKIPSVSSPKCRDQTSTAVERVVCTAGWIDADVPVLKVVQLRPDKSSYCDRILCRCRLGGTALNVGCGAQRLAMK